MTLHLSLVLGSEVSAILRWLALLLTYCVQAAIWAGAVMLLTRRALPAAITNRLWRWALLGPLATSALLALWSAGSLAAWASPGSLQPMAALSVGAVVAHAVSVPWAARGSFESRLLAGLFAAGLVLGCLRFLCSLARLRRVLLGRTPVRDARLCQRFEQLRRRTRVTQARLTECARVPGPLIVGRRELCIPSGELVGYTDDEVDAIFAHELAHLERGDALWFPLVGCVEAVLWMQPVNRWVSARYRRSAELACDDRAVELTGAPLALARALTRMAHAAAPVRNAVLVPAMASQHNACLQRVQRLVTTSAAPRSARYVQSAARCVPLGLIIVGLLGPSLGVETAPALPSRKRVAAVDVLFAAPNAASYDTEMRDLAVRAQQLEGQLASHPSDDLANAQVLELRQALRHVRETQRWTEHRYEDELEAWEERAARVSMHQ